MRLGRRDFLKLGGTVALLGALEGKIVYNNLEKKAPAEAASNPVVKYGVCGICQMSCALKGYVVDGTLVKLEGNELDQQSGGALCAKGNAGINLLYDPNRLKYPLLRTNPEKGLGVDPKWKRISWEEAFQIASKKLKEAINQGGPKSVVWIGNHGGKDFLSAIGSPNDICHHSTCNTMRITACNATIGAGGYVPDLARSAYIISFGWDQFGKGKNAWARALATNLANGTGKLVVFDPRLSVTASKADEWFPIRPGTDHAVAMAMINVIINEKLYDHDFVAKNTSGFDQLAKMINPYTPQWASKISDIPAEEISSIAREFSAAPSACIPMHKREAIQVRANGWSLSRAILILMALTGNIEKPGGAIIPRKIKLGNVGPKTKPPKLETTVRVDGGEQFPLSLTEPFKGHGIYQTVPDNILKDKPYPVKALIVFSQGLDSMPNPQKWVEAFKKVGFMININIYPDDMATLADLVLPEPTYLEKGAVSARELNAFYPQLAVGEPMVEPMYDCMPLPKIKAELAKRLGVAQFMPPIGPETTQEQLKPLGISVNDVLKSGGVYTPSTKFEPMDLTNIKTPSKKISLYSDLAAKHGYEPLPVHRNNWLINADGRNTFYLTTTRFAFNRHGKTANLRWLHELMPENFVYINTAAGERLGIHDDDPVIVESNFGKIKIKVKLIQGIRPDTICIPHGFGHRSKFLHLAGGKGANDGEIMPSFNLDQTLKLNDPSGSAVDCQMVVKIRRA